MTHHDDKQKHILEHIDPVCGMNVNEDTADKSRYEGETFYFCSTDCKDRFEAQPADYAKSVVPK